MAKSSNYRAPVRAHRDIIDRDGVVIPVIVRPCSVCGGPKDGLSTSGMCKACERDNQWKRRHGRDKPLLQATPDRRKETEDAAPALPVPPARFVPVVRREPMRRSTRAERYSEMSERWRDMLVPFNVPTAEMTSEERRRYGR